MADTYLRANADGYELHGDTIMKRNRKPTPEILWRLMINLKKLRAARGYTQHALADICGFSKSYISNVEQGTVNITLANLETIADGLDCGAEDLLRLPFQPPRLTTAIAE